MNKKTIDHLNLLRKIVWSFHQSTGLDWDDLFQEAYIAYTYAMTTYDPSKGAISTFLWTHISNQLRTYYKKEKNITDPLVDIKALYAHSVQQDTFFESLTSDAQIIAQMVLRTKVRFIKLSPKKAKERVIDVMQQSGWRYERIKPALDNLMLACSSF